MSRFSLATTSLISGLAQPNDVPKGDNEETVESVNETRRRRERAKAHNLQNSDGAFCWREGCDSCLGTTKALQNMAEAFALLSDVFDANVGLMNVSVIAKLRPALRRVMLQARTVMVKPLEQLTEYSLPRERYRVRPLSFQCNGFELFTEIGLVNPGHSDSSKSSGRQYGATYLARGWQKRGR